MKTYLAVNTRYHKILWFLLVAILLISPGACKKKASRIVPDEQGSSAESVSTGEGQNEVQRLLLENYALQNEVNRLRQAVSTEIEKCNIEKRAEINKARVEQKERNAAISAKQKEAERTALINKLKTSALTLAEWNEILIGASRSMVEQYLGNPIKKTKPQQHNSFLFEIWNYPNKVKEEPNSPASILNVYFDSDGVVKVDATK